MVKTSEVEQTKSHHFKGEDTDIWYAQNYFHAHFYSNNTMIQ